MVLLVQVTELVVHLGVRSQHVYEVERRQILVPILFRFFALVLLILRLRLLLQLRLHQNLRQLMLVIRLGFGFRQLQIWL